MNATPCTAVGALYLLTPSPGAGSVRPAVPSNSVTGAAAGTGVCVAVWLEVDVCVAVCVCDAVLVAVWLEVEVCVAVWEAVEDTEEVMEDVAEEVGLLEGVLEGVAVMEDVVEAVCELEKEMDTVWVGLAVAVWLDVAVGEDVTVTAAPVPVVRISVPDVNLSVYTSPEMGSSATPYASPM